MADSEAKVEEVFEVDRIRNLVELMKEFDLREIDLRQGDQRIRLCRGGEAAPGLAVVPVNAATPASAVARPLLQPMPVSSDAAPGPHNRSAPAEETHIAHIVSPMVGTFYSRANPKAEPYVNVGDQVNPDTTVCVIEAMKVFNEIPAEVRGRIVAILVDDEEPVEYGRPLFKVETGA